MNAVSPSIAWCCGSVMLAASLVVNFAARAAKRRREAALTAVTNPNLESVGELVDALSDGDGRCDRQCRDTLIKLLPLLNNSNAHLLDEYRQAKLRYIVRPPASPIYSTYLTKLSR